MAKFKKKKSEPTPESENIEAPPTEIPEIAKTPEKIPSMPSKANVAIIPETVANIIRNQYNWSSFFLYDAGSGAGVSGIFSGVFAISGISVGGASIFSDSGVGSDFFFLNFAN